MKVDEKVFRNTALKTIEDPRLSAAYASGMRRNRTGRDAVCAEVPDVEDLRDELKKIRSATIANLWEHLQIFEHNATQSGAQVHWAQGQEDVARIVLDIARQQNARRVVKSKSMVSEEVHLNQILEEAGLLVVETDLGEYIIQLAGETPSHIITPAIHQTKEQIAELFAQKLGQRVESDPNALTRLARQTLRQIFLEADIGISGVNLGVAETGSIVLVTNEGNGRLTTSLPKVHIAVMGIERLAPTWEDAGVWLSLLARFATAQPFSVYTSVITGPAREHELDGPEQVHIILLDNNRSRLTGTKYEEVLQCIRCGACLSVCPVYLASGGHAYHSPYSGPIGAVISPLLFGLENYKGLPNASTLCGACLDVCPVRIDLPRMLRELRVDQVEQGLVPLPERTFEKTAAKMLETPRWMQIFFGLGRFGQLILKLFNLKVNQLENYPMVANKSFREQWAEQQEEPDERQG
ncbi:iron-sulfur cluster-binding protein [bacterium]|nr:iron-sulfur cluster-binding protein [bacterium]MCB2179070.1 iron-sulfur cluster-binding protein [bacterium]